MPDKRILGVIGGSDVYAVYALTCVWKSNNEAL